MRQKILKASLDYVELEIGVAHMLSLTESHPELYSFRDNRLYCDFPEDIERYYSDYSPALEQILQNIKHTF